MTSSFPIGSLLRVPIRVHYSWFGVFALVTTAQSWQFHAIAEWPLAIVAGLVAALFLFSSVVLHELGHCVAARAFGIHVRRIQLFLFGGVAEILGEPRRVLDEIVIAAAGPAVSIAIACATAPIAWILPEGVLRSLAWFVCGVNALLFFFNLVPAFPTDGGRILRAIFWGIFGDYRRATRWAAGLGIAFASLLVAGGVAVAFGASHLSPPEELASLRLSGTWMAMVGLFLARSARHGVEQARISAALRGARVGDVMLPLTIVIAADRTLLQALTAAGGPSAAEMLLGFPVTDAGVCVGFVEPANLYAVPREEWGAVRAGEIMTPLDALPRMQVTDALDRLVEEIVARGAAGALVYDGERLAGYAGRSDVGRFLMESREPVAA